MIKIVPESSVNEVLPKTVQQTEKPAGTSFEDVLNQKIEEFTPSQPQTEQTLLVNRVPDLLLIPPVEETEAVSKLEKLLDTLDEFSEKLSDVNITPKDLSLLISKIDLEKEELGILSEAVTDNAELKQIIEETLIRSTTEVVKFNRGDYL